MEGTGWKSGVRKGRRGDGGNRMEIRSEKRTEGRWREPDGNQEREKDGGERRGNRMEIRSEKRTEGRGEGTGWKSGARKGRRGEAREPDGNQE